MTDRPIRVLIVEDNPDDLRHVLKLLERGAAGPATTLTAGSVGEAVGLLRGGAQADVALLDLALPDTTAGSL